MKKTFVFDTPVVINNRYEVQGDSLKEARERLEKDPGQYFMRPMTTAYVELADVVSGRVRIRQEPMQLVHVYREPYLIWQSGAQPYEEKKDEN